MNPRDMEAELGLYWRLARQRAAIRIAYEGRSMANTGFVEIEDDLDVIAVHSEWPALQDAAMRLLYSPMKAVAR